MFFLCVSLNKKNPNKIVMRTNTVDGAFIAIKLEVSMLNSLLTSADECSHVEKKQNNHVVVL